jgi:hypothetical protein
MVKLILVFLIAIVLQTCSADKDPEAQIETRNGIHYKGVFYPLNMALIKEIEFNISKIYAALEILGYDGASPENIAISSVMHIKAISADKRALDFEFTRPNGEIITEVFKDAYSEVSN